MFKSFTAARAKLIAPFILLLTANAAYAEEFPTRPLTVVVPYAAGGNLDVVTRLVTAEMGKILGETIVVANRPGAGGLIGHNAVLKNKPDGYTLVATANGSYAYSPKLQTEVPFRPADFAPIGMIGITPLVLEVHADSQFQTLEALIEQARSRPREISIGHAGNGTTNHIAILQLQRAFDVEFNVVPYNGSAPALNDLLGGQIDAIIDQLPSSIAHINSRKLRALAVTSSKRAKDLPEMRTLAEAGAEGFEVVTAAGLLVPAGAAATTVNTLNDALNKALNAPEVKERLAKMGSEALPTTPSEFGEFLQGEVATAESLVQSGDLTTH